MRHTLLSDHNHLYELARRDGLRLPAGFSDTTRKWIDRLYPVAAIFFSLATPLLAGLFAIGPILIVMAFENQVQSVSISPDLLFIIQLVSGFLPIYFLVWIWTLLLEQRHLWTVGLERKGAFGKYIKGALLGLVIFSAAVGLMGLFGFLVLKTGAEKREAAALAGVLVLLAGWIVQGGAEEVLARGYLLPVVGSRYGTPAGILVSALVFASWHLLNPNLSVLAVINLLLFGVFAAFYALNEGGVWGVCAFHSIWNWAEGNLFGFEVSGAAFGTSTVLTLQTSGPDWFTGGKFGPEGGLAVTLVLVAGCLWLFIASFRNRAF